MLVILVSKPCRQDINTERISSTEQAWHYLQITRNRRRNHDNIVRFSQHSFGDRTPDIPCSRFSAQNTKTLKH